MSFSKYFDLLDPPAKKRYCEKLKLIDGIDPFAIEDGILLTTSIVFPQLHT